MSVGRDDCPRVRLPSLPRGLELFFFLLLPLLSVRGYGVGSTRAPLDCLLAMS